MDTTPICGNSQLSNPGIPHPRVRCTLEEMLSEEEASRTREWEVHTERLDWSPGKTKHDQMRSALGRAAALEINRDYARDFVIRQIHRAGAVPNIRDIDRSADHFYAESSERPDTPTPRREFEPDFARRFAERVDCPDPIEYLRSKSPVPPEATTSEGFLRAAFREDENVIVLTDLREMGTIVPIGDISVSSLPQRAPDGVRFLTCPVDGRSHLNPREGDRPSLRSEEAITDFRHLLIESDSVEIDQWLRIVIQLPVPILSMCLSGGASVHTLVRVDARSKLDFDRIRNRMLPMLSVLGADPNAMKAVQLARLPQAWRGDQQQRLLYLNPRPDTAAPRPLNQH